MRRYTLPLPEKVFYAIGIIVLLAIEYLAIASYNRNPSVGLTPIAIVTVFCLTFAVLPYFFLAGSIVPPKDVEFRTIDWTGIKVTIKERSVACERFNYFSGVIEAENSSEDVIFFLWLGRRISDVTYDVGRFVEVSVINGQVTYGRYAWAMNKRPGSVGHKVIYKDNVS